MFKTIFSITAIVVAGGIFFLYTEPAYNGLQALSAQNAQYDQALAKATQLQALKQTLLSKYNAFDPNQIQRLSTMLPDQVDNIRLILDLDNMAALYGMGLQNVNISSPDSSDNDQTAVGALSTSQLPYSSISMTFSTSGTYPQFKQFLGALQSSLRLVDISSLSMAQDSTPVSGTASSSQPIYTYDITLNTYWLR
jgi:Tfp pilus assembly protein PilO